MCRTTLAAVLIAVFALTSAAGEAEDPYLWLEEVDGAKAMEWVLAQNEKALGTLEKVPEFEPIEARFQDIYNSRDRIPYVGIRGSYLYNFWQDADHPRGIWRRTTLDEFRKEEPGWEVLIDIDAMSEADGEMWVYKGSTCLPPEYRLCMIALSPGGGDAVIRREYDTVDKTWVEDGFDLPLAKSDVSWRDADSLWVNTDFGEGTLTYLGLALFEMLCNG